MDGFFSKGYTSIMVQHLDACSWQFESKCMNTRLHKLIDHYVCNSHFAGFIFVSKYVSLTHLSLLML